MDYDMVIAKILSSPEQKKFGYAIKTRFIQLEESSLDSILNQLSSRGAEYLWTEGYEIEKLKLMALKFDLSTVLGIGVRIDAKKALTIRQFCYQFVKMNEESLNEVQKLRSELKLIKANLRKLKRRRKVV